MQTWVCVQYDRIGSFVNWAILPPYLRFLHRLLAPPFFLHGICQIHFLDSEPEHGPPAPCNFEWLSLPTKPMFMEQFSSQKRIVPNKLWAWYLSTDLSIWNQKVRFRQASKTHVNCSDQCPSSVISSSSVGSKGWMPKALKPFFKFSSFRVNARRFHRCRN